MTELNEDNSREVWFAEIDGKVFTFKHKVSNRLKGVLETRSENKSRSFASRWSTRSSSSRHSSKSNSSTRETASQEKLRVAERVAGAKSLEKQRAAEYQAKKCSTNQKQLNTGPSGTLKNDKFPSAMKCFNTTSTFTNFLWGRNSSSK